MVGRSADSSCLSALDRRAENGMATTDFERVSSPEMKVKIFDQHLELSMLLNTIQ